MITLIVTIRLPIVPVLIIGGVGGTIGYYYWKTYKKENKQCPTTPVS